MKPSETHFLPCQIDWIKDQSSLRIIQKSRQVGMSYADAYNSVVTASEHRAPSRVSRARHSVRAAN